MKKQDFIDSWARLVREGRRRNFPDMRPSEEAMSAVDDKAKAAKMWRKHRAALAPMSIAEWEATQKGKAAA